MRAGVRPALGSATLLSSLFDRCRCDQIRMRELLMAVVAIVFAMRDDLAANFAAREPGGVHIRITVAVAKSAEKSLEVIGVETLV